MLLKGWPGFLPMGRFGPLGMLVMMRLLKL
jgi:hypothetical protein